MYDKETFSPVFKPPMMNFFANTFVQSGKWLPLMDTSRNFLVEKETDRCNEGACSLLFRRETVINQGAQVFLRRKVIQVERCNA